MTAVALECGHKIEIEKTGTAVTYCILPLGHQGKCKPDAGIVARYEKEKGDDGRDKNTNAH